MPYDQMKILHQGDEYGNGMIVRISLSTGRKTLRALLPRISTQAIGTWALHGITSLA